jgi:hypothetical protein
MIESIIFFYSNLRNVILKTPYLSTIPKFLLLIIASLLFGFNQTAHAEGLSGLKESLNKGKIESTIMEQTNQQSDISDVPPVSTSVTKPPKKIQNPIKNTQIKKPARIKDTPLKKMNSNLKRIDAPIETPIVVPYLFTISQFPSIDESKYNPEAIKALKAMKEKAESYNTIEYDLNNFTEKYPANTELCNLGRLYFIQQILKTYKQYDFKTQKYLEELTNDFVYESNEVTVFIDSEVNKKMVPVLNKYNQTYIEKSHAYVLKEIERRRQEIERYKTDTFKSSDLERIKEDITLLYRQMIEDYEGILVSYSLDIVKAKELRDEMAKFYKELSLQIPIKVQDSPGLPIEIKKLDIIKDSITCGTYITFLYRFIENDFEHCQLFFNDSQKYEHILNKSSDGINTFEDLLNTVNNPESGETISEETKKYYIECVKKYRNNVGKITKLYFNKENSYGTLTPDYIAKTNECILLKAEVKYDDQSYASTPPVKIELFSNVSKTTIEVLLRKSAIAKGNCAVFGNYNANTWPIVDSPDKQKESIAVLSGYAEDVKDGKYLYDSIYFNTKLLYSTMGTTTIDIQQGIIPSSENFCQAGGGEFITANLKNNKNIKADIIIKNQAKWFVIESHGDSVDGSIQYGLSDGKWAILKFGQAKELFKYNIDVLFLDSCYCLSYNTTEAEIWVKGWHKALPRGLIAGYHNVVSPFMTSGVFKNFAKKLNECRVNGKILTKNEIGQMWLNINIAYSQYPFAINGSDALKARYALNENNDEYYKYWYIGFVQALPTSPSITKPLHFKLKE